MPVLTREQFKAQFTEVVPDYEAMARLPALSWLPALNFDIAWAIYVRASKPSLGFNVMGRTVIDKKTGTGADMRPKAPGEYGSAIDIAEHYNFGLNSSDGNLSDYTGLAFNPGSTGSILNFYDGRSEGNTGWHFAYNDSWVLGGIHGGIDFQIASPRTADNLWEGIPGNITVTGRELIGLTTFGYRIQRTVLNEVAVCDKTDLAARASLRLYLDAVAVLNRRELVLAQLAG